MRQQQGKIACVRQWKLKNITAAFSGGGHWLYDWKSRESFLVSSCLPILVIPNVSTALLMLLGHEKEDEYAAPSASLCQLLLRERGGRRDPARAPPVSLRL